MEIIEQSYHLTKIGLSLGDIRDVLKLARALNAINTRQCNGYRASQCSPYYNGQEERDLRKEEKVKKQINAILGTGMAVFQGDPRGAPIIINEGGQTEFRIWG